MAGQTWEKVEQRTLSDEVYQAVRSRILEGTFAPGTFVREQEVSDGLGVSRTPVREAMGRLASEGFLERLPHRGFRVPDEPIGTLLELYPIVSALELLAGRLALPRLGDEDLETLERINRELTEARSRDDVPRLIDLDNEFHRTICAVSGNDRLCDMLEDLRGQLTRLEFWYYSKLDRTEESIAEHDELIRLIREERFPEALDLIENNLLGTYRHLLAEEDGTSESESVLPQELQASDS